MVNRVDIADTRKKVFYAEADYSQDEIDAVIKVLKESRLSLINDFFGSIIDIKITNKEKFFSRVGLDDYKHLITYTTSTERSFPLENKLIADGKVGPITKKIKDEYFRVTHSCLVETDLVCEPS